MAMMTSRSFLVFSSSFSFAAFLLSLSHSLVPLYSQCYLVQTTNKAPKLPPAQNDSIYFCFFFFCFCLCCCHIHSVFISIFLLRSLSNQLLSTANLRLKSWTLSDTQKYVFIHRHIPTNMHAPHISSQCIIQCFFFFCGVCLFTLACVLIALTQNDNNRNIRKRMRT